MLVFSGALRGRLFQRVGTGRIVSRVRGMGLDEFSRGILLVFCIPLLLYAVG